MDMMTMALKSFGLSPEMIQGKINEASEQFKAVTKHFDDKLDVIIKKQQELEARINALYPVPENARHIATVVAQANKTETDEKEEQNAA